MSKTVKREDVDQLADVSDLEKLGLSFESIDEAACVLLAYQRAQHISRRARLSWEAGKKEVLSSEVVERRQSIIQGAFLEIYQEYLPLKNALTPVRVSSVCDIGCGQAINDVFLHLDFKPEFTLVDIETTEDQYHFWSDSGSGYASLAAAKALLVENGAEENQVTSINPRKEKWSPIETTFDLVTSLYSCGFHYPIDGYLDLFIRTIETGGAVCLDLRRHYLKTGSEALSLLNALASPMIVYEDRKSIRMLYRSAGAD